MHPAPATKLTAGLLHPGLTGLISHIKATQAKANKLGARVVRVTKGDGVAKLSERVDKRHLTRMTPMAQYFDVSLDNYRVYALNDTGSTFTLVSSALAKELGLRINPAGKARFKVVDGAVKSFVGTLDEQVI